MPVSTKGTKVHNHKIHRKSKFPLQSTSPHVGSIYLTGDTAIASSMPWKFSVRAYRLHKK